MEFDVEYYEALNGKQYAREFLDELENKNEELWNITVGLIKNLKHKQYHNTTLFKSIGWRII